MNTCWGLVAPWQPILMHPSVVFLSSGTSWVEKLTCCGGEPLVSAPDCALADSEGKPSSCTVTLIV